MYALVNNKVGNQNNFFSFNILTNIYEMQIDKTKLKIFNILTTLSLKSESFVIRMSKSLRGLMSFKRNIDKNALSIA